MNECNHRRVEKKGGLPSIFIFFNVQMRLIWNLATGCCILELVFIEADLPGLLMSKDPTL